MVQSAKDKPMLTPAPKTSPSHVPNMAAMTRRLGLATVPAAWPTGVSHLAQAVDACQRCDASEVCTDWLRRTPDQVVVPPAFCPNTAEFKRAKQAKER